jgi:hypothetical protein
MNAAPMPKTARDVARGLSLFEIDESLAALVEAAEADAEASHGEISDSIKSALATYAEAFGYKADRIADFLKAQRAEAEIAQREAERLQNRHRAAENREKRLKHLLAWFMQSRHVPKLRGEFNTIVQEAKCERNSCGTSRQCRRMSAKLFRLLFAALSPECDDAAIQGKLAPAYFRRPATRARMAVPAIR